MVDLEKARYGLDDLRTILDVLRAPGGCPWDAEQTHQSIRRDFIEEAYEAAEAIDRGDNAALCEELGDVLLQVVFHAAIAQSEGAFDLNDVADGICRKLIFRHPHVFGTARIETSGEVLDAWEKLKRQEKGQATHSEAIDQIARSLPALMYAEKVQKKARKAGFDWPDVTGALQKVNEETRELEAAIESGQGIEDELGDLLFAAVNVARFVKTDPEQALLSASAKFIRRFKAMEAVAERPMEDMSFEELDSLWDSVKRQENKDAY